MHKYVAMDMYSILLKFVGRALISSSMRGKNDHALLGESRKLLLEIGLKTEGVVSGL